MKVAKICLGLEIYHCMMQGNGESCGISTQIQRPTECSKALRTEPPWIFILHFSIGTSTSYCRTFPMPFQTRFQRQYLSTPKRASSWIRMLMTPCPKFSITRDLTTHNCFLNHLMVLFYYQFRVLSARRGIKARTCHLRLALSTGVICFPENLKTSSDNFFRGK